MQLCKASFLAAAAGLVSGVFGQTPPFRVIVKTGDTVPGISGATWLHLSVPVIDQYGRIAFASLHDDNGEVEGHWLATSVIPPAFSAIALRQQSAPGWPSTGEYGTLYANNPPNLRDATSAPDVLNTAYVNSLTEPGLGLWTGEPSSRSLRVSQVAGTLLVSIFPGWSAGGHICYDGSNGNSRYIQLGSSAIAIASIGSQIPAPEEASAEVLVSQFLDTYFGDDLTPSQIKINDGGVGIFGVALSGSGTSSATNAGIYIYDSTEMHRVARRGYQISSVAYTPSLLSQRPTIASENSMDAAPIAFDMYIDGVDTDADYVLLAGTWESLAIVAREGTSTGIIPGTSFSDFNRTTVPGIVFGASNVTLNEFGRVVFGGFVEGDSVTDANQSVLWTWQAGSLSVVSREGSPAPGTAYNFGTLVASVPDEDTHYIPGKVAINSLGEVAFIAYYTSELAVDPEDAKGLWIRDFHGSLRLVVRTGSVIQVGVGDSRTVGDVEMFGGRGILTGCGGSDGQGTPLTDSGLLAYWVQFTDGSEAILTGDVHAGVQCPADVDDGTGTGTPDGGVTIDDLLYYLEIFEAGSVNADLDDGTFTGTPDGGVTIDDLLYFLEHFEAGC